MDKLIYIPLAIGIFGGAYLGYWSSKALVLRLSKGSHPSRLVLWCAAIGALLAALPSIVLAFIIGANFGGTLGDAARFSPALRAAAVPSGIAFGITVVLGGGLAIGVVVGALMGRLIAYVMRKLAPTTSGTL